MVSTFPASKKDKDNLPTDKSTLVAANGSQISCFGPRKITISIMGRQYTWPFLIADVRTPLLGADFLAHHGLLVNVRRKALLDTETYQTH